MKPLVAISVCACCAWLLAACGGSSHRAPGAAASAQLRLSECMRAHGIRNFPDPVEGAGGEGLSVSVGVGSETTTIGGIPFSGPAFESAIKACKFFGGGSAPAPISESQKLQLFHFAECMRAHGLSDYPDPVFPPGGGIERPSAPGLNVNSPAFQRAAKLCNRA